MMDIPGISFLLVAGDRDLNLKYRTEVTIAAGVLGLEVETILVETNHRAHEDVIAVSDRLIDMMARPWLGAAHDAALDIAEYPVYVYCCNHHMTFRDGRWLQDLIEALGRPDVAIAGDVRQIGFGFEALPEYEPFKNNSVPAFDYNSHVQGGIWAGLTETVSFVRSHPRYPHGYEDVVRSWRLMEMGVKLGHVDAIFSTGVRGQVCPDDSKYHAIHDYR